MNKIQQVKIIIFLVICSILSLFNLSIAQEQDMAVSLEQTNASITEGPADIKDLLSSQIFAKGVTARLYDKDTDGVLQTTEMQYFLQDVVSFVARRGGYAIQEDADFLSAFDLDKNGVIDRQEAWEFKNSFSNLLNQAKQ